MPGDPPIVSCEINSSLPFFIKYCHVQWADGSVGQLVFILQWPTVPKGMFIEMYIVGLTILLIEPRRIKYIYVILDKAMDLYGTGSF